ncbi:PfkB family carbohydrate kinase [Cellulomonas chengniuliangii]|uniref:PfkB family carbohydrate kinase n=1 Tax=Cellulomonas chengniuliangii TaxID=2968084 RepID=A0ABY5KUX7_9CELL|nr:PfkB family carbohydrate kinase [Cellulomonas chengniuliangii]MCC2308919.1 PfkB family carbohydrate kinase [Cellulomonas chengniuliangii]MCC2319446.1 PfkB family carbohydrate kinase [Cellulomonas chengniuliangii]UUI74342.1 PfkB family carbohydrate kinase [Cellulomonas chengniuliangii]
MERRPWLVCCGLVTLDVVQVVDHVPAPDEKVVAHDLQVDFGGPAANAAATAAALGVPTRLVTAIGSGPVADMVRAGLAAAGVDVVDLRAGEAASPAVSTVLVTRATGERAVASVNGQGMGDLGDQARSVLPGVLGGATALLLDGHHLSAARALAQAARERGIPVALDGGSWKDGLGELLALVDHAVLSADFRLPAALLGGSPAPPRGSVEDLAAVAALGPRTVARSAGAGPLRWLEAARGHGAAARSDVPSPQVRTVLPPVLPPGAVVDTLGAGDVLHGAFAARLAQGATVEAALEAAVEVATRSVRHAGARGWVGAVPAEMPDAAGGTTIDR